MRVQLDKKYKLFIWLIILFLLPGTVASAQTSTRFKRIPIEYIVALGDPSASLGTGAQLWGLWRHDPGSRGCSLDNYEKLKADGGIAPARWKFDNGDWWLEEHGLLMEKPEFPLPPGQYVVTGGRLATAVLTIFPPDKEGISRWELNKGKLYDVTHLPCHAARYTPEKNDRICSPDKTQMSVFPVAPGVAMPAVEGCRKQDYSVLFVIGVAE